MTLRRRERMEFNLDSRLAQMIGNQRLLVDRVQHVRLRAEHQRPLHATEFRKGRIERAAAVFGEVELIRWSIEASVVVLPEPVGPVTRTSPRGRLSSSSTAGGSPISSSDIIFFGIVRSARPSWPRCR